MKDWKSALRLGMKALSNNRLSLAAACSHKASHRVQATQVMPLRCLATQVLSKALWIMGIVTAGVTGISCLLALWKSISVTFGRVTRAGVCLFLPMAYALVPSTWFWHLVLPRLQLLPAPEAWTAS